MGVPILTPVPTAANEDDHKILGLLLREARKLAACEGVTLRTVVERGPHLVATEAKQNAPFKLRRATFKGKGLQPDLRHASWDQIRDLVCEGRGAPSAARHP